MQLIFGKNVKKIRSIHGMSQQEFADIFDLKRGTLGAYEEGRSNPKLETVIKIANHFSIGIEELLVGELTVNKLLRFNERLSTETEGLKTIEFDGIPCVLPTEKAQFIKSFSDENFVASLPEVQLPYLESRNRMAFSVDDLSMTGGAVEFFPKDIVIGLLCDKNTVENKSLVVALTKDEMLFRKLFKNEGQFILKADHHGVEDVVLLPEQLLGVWKIEHVFQNTLHLKEMLLENRLTEIEQHLASLKK